MQKIGISREKSDFFAKCLQQIEIPDLLDMCAPCSELPSYMRTMVPTKYVMDFSGKFGGRIFIVDCGTGVSSISSLHP